jgi:23S rRNA pseudouridine1911/1915/1917 synthase
MQALTFQAPSAGRLDALLKQASELSNSRSRNAVSTGKVFVNGERVLDPATYIAAGTPIELRPNAPDPARTEPEGLRLVFRDEHLLVVDKPAGLLSAPLPDSEEVSALHAAYKLARGGDRPRNVHRLDKETSGLLIFARTTEAARLLRQMLDAHEIRRIYRCVVQGVPKPPSGMISSMVLRDTGEGKRGSRPSTFKVRPLNMPDPGPAPGYGKLAITRYEMVAAQNDRAALEVWLSTGRTHQIRIHLAELGTPVLGERVYARVPGAPRQALHAAKLIFNHPVTREVMTFQSPWPKDLASVTPLGPGW